MYFMSQLYEHIHAYDVIMRVYRQGAGVLPGYGVTSRDYAAAANADAYLAAHGLGGAASAGGHGIGPLTNYGPVSWRRPEVLQHGAESIDCDYI